jgi:polyisoprenoid-binding protein YceI
MQTVQPMPPSTAPTRIETSNQKRRPRQWLRWTIGVIVGLVVLIVGGTTIYVHTITAPAMLTLPKVASSGPSGQVTVDGVWKAGAGSIAGWRVQQVLFGQESPIVGRTDKVWGSITIANGAVTQGSFSVDMAAVTSSLSKTTQRTVFDESAYPTATLALTSPITLGAIPANGVVERFAATGTLTLHGASRPVHFTASVEGASGSIYVLAGITFPYGDWKISAQGVPFLADLQSPATIEVLLHLTQGAGNPASVG